MRVVPLPSKTFAKTLRLHHEYLAISDAVFPKFERIPSFHNFPFFIFNSVFTGFFPNFELFPKKLGIDCIADLNLYMEFIITMSVPMLGVLLIYLGYQCRLRHMHRSIDAMTTDAGTDAEKGGQVLDKYGNELALADRKYRDSMVYFSIGWLFLVYTCATGHPKW